MSHRLAAATARLSLLGALLLSPLTPAAFAPAPSTPSGETHLFLGPTARPLPRGEGYFVLHGGLVPAFQVGITDRVSVGAGTFYFADGNVWVTPKVQLVRRGATSASATLVHLMVPGEGSFGLAFASVTHDTGDGGITVGVGGAYAHGWDNEHDWAHGGPLIMLGADRRLNRRVVFLSENYVVAGNGAMLINGIRTSWSRFSLDTGIMLLVGDGVFGGPIVNLAWRF